ncbi:MAG: L-rhamnose mutarotase [Parabacteroides sp.]|nr:L-rhamnose mutarotase [Parabacteroides sp.]
MKRHAFKMYLKPGYEVEYERRHNEIWPELQKELKESSISDYSIYWDRESNYLFAFQMVDDSVPSHDPSPVLWKWWAYMADIMDTNPDTSPVSVSLQEVFHMD